MDTGAIHFDAVLVSPLLPFLTDAVTDDNDAVEAHTADDRLGNAPAGGDLAHAGLRGDRADNVSAGAGGQVGRADHRDRRRHLFHFRVTGQARDHGFFELQMLVKYIRGVRMALLSRRRPPYEEQRQCYHCLFHSVQLNGLVKRNQYTNGRMKQAVRGEMKVGRIRR